MMPMKNLRSLALALLAVPCLAQAAWTYKTCGADACDIPERLAILQSSNSVPSATVGKGDIRVSLVIRATSESISPYLAIDNGRFRCPSTGCKVSARFDQGEWVEVSTAPVQESSTAPIQDTASIHLSQPKVMLETIRLARSVTFEVSVAGAGNQQFLFDTSDLDWPPLPVEAKLDAGIGEQKWAAPPSLSLSDPSPAKGADAVCYAAPTPRDSHWQAAKPARISYCFAESRFSYAVVESASTAAGVAALRQLSVALMGRKADTTRPGDENWRGAVDDNLVGATLRRDPNKQDSPSGVLVIHYTPMENLTEKMTR